MSIWLPSLSELIGTTGTQSVSSGCYKSAMQGLNASAAYWTDVKGGSQFAYFKPYNASGGGEAIWEKSNRQAVWLRSPVFAYANKANAFDSINGVGYAGVAESRTVHPAVLYNEDT